MGADNSIKSQLMSLLQNEGFADSEDLLSEFLLILSASIEQGKLRETSFLVEDSYTLTKFERVSIKSLTSANIFNELGKLSRRVRKPDHASEFYNRALSVYTELENREGIVKIKLNLANLSLSQGQFATAKSVYEELVDEGIDPDTKSLVYMNLGSTLYQMGSIEEAMKNYITARQLFVDLSDTRNLANIELNIGVVYLNQLDYDMALTHFSSSASYFSRINDKRGELIVREQIIKAIISKGDKEDAKKMGFDYLKEIDPTVDYRLFSRFAYLVLPFMTNQEILDCYDPFIKTVQVKIEDPPEIFQITFHYAKALVQEKQEYKESKQLLDQLDRISQALRDTEANYLIQSQLAWIDYYTANHESLEERKSFLFKQGRHIDNQTRFDIAILSLLTGSPDITQKLLKGNYNPDWMADRIFATNVVYLLSLNSDSKEFDKVITDLEKSPDILLRHRSITLLQEYLANERYQQNTTKESITGLCLSINPEITHEPKNCTSVPCFDLVKHLIENPPYQLT